MIVKSVKLHNIRSYLSEKISFPEGSLLLSGDIGSGKSTILLAIEFALFGVIRGEVDGAALLRHGKTDGYVEVQFDLDGREIVIINGVEDDEQDLMQDFVSIITSFTARLYGKRRSKRKTEKIIETLSK